MNPNTEKNEENEATDYPRTHILFPTFEETKNGAPFYSDHLPILLSVNETEKPINIISYNILGHISCSGLHYKELGETESEEQQKERYHKMAQGLLRTAQKQSVDAIFLQETPPELMSPALKEVFGDDWEIVETDRTGIITCYNKQRFLCHEVTLDARHRVHTFLVRDKHTNTSVSLNNIWGIFSPVPFDGQEALYQRVLNNSADIAILALRDPLIFT